MEDIICKKCQNQVQEAKYVAASGFKYHIGCFTCNKCSIELASEEFFEKDVQKNEFYCLNCYFTLFGKICEYCKEVIKENFIQALDKWFHPEHFVCEGCQAPIKGNCFYKHNDKPYCKEDFLKVNNAVCTGCGKYILDRIYSALNKSWHGFCFKCQHCQKPFTDFKFVEHEEQPYHEQCYSLLFGIKCHACNDKIIGSYLQANEQPLHESCFICKVCQKSLEKETWIEQNNCYYCQSCFLSTVAQSEGKKEKRKQSQAQVSSQEQEKQASKPARAEQSDQKPPQQETTQNKQTPEQKSEVQAQSQKEETKGIDEAPKKIEQPEFKKELSQISEAPELERNETKVDQKIAQTSSVQAEQKQIEQNQQEQKKSEEKQQAAQQQESSVPQVQEITKTDQQQASTQQQAPVQQKEKPQENHPPQPPKESIRRRSSAVSNAALKVQKQATTKEESKHETAAKTSDSVEKTYTFEQLQGNNLPPEVDPANKELWLDEDVFKKKFGCDKESYKSLPTWKKVMLRKKANFF